MGGLSYKLSYRARQLASFLPFKALRFLGRHWRLGEEPADGWNFWIAADYHKYCRIDKRLNRMPACMSCGGNDGYGPPPHHTPDCYFASWEDEAQNVEGRHWGALPSR